MNIIPFFGKSGNPKYAIIFDISSESVGVALITHNHKKSTSPKILYTNRVPIEFSQETSAKHLSRSLFKAVANASESVMSEFSSMKNKNKIEKNFDVHAIVHPPWAESESGIAKQSFSTPAKMQKGTVNDLLVKYFAKNSTSNLMSARITEIKLNNYVIKNPLNKDAKDIEIVFMLGYIHPLIKESIENGIKNFLGERKLYFNTFLYAISELAKNLNSKYKNYILSDIGNEYADFSVIINGILKDRESVEFGSNNLISPISESSSKDDLLIARSKFKMFDENASTPTQNKLIKESLSKTKDDWIKIFGETCSSLSKKSSLPDTLFLCTSSFAYNWFKDTMEKIDFAQFTATAKPFKVLPIINEKDVEQYYDNSSVAKDRKLLIASLFVDKYGPKSMYDKLFVI